MKYNELPLHFQNLAKQWAIDELNEIEKEANTGYINNYNNDIDRIVIDEILSENEYKIEYSDIYPDGLLKRLLW